MVSACAGLSCMTSHGVYMLVPLLFRCRFCLVFLCVCFAWSGGPFPDFAHQSCSFRIHSFPHHVLGQLSLPRSGAAWTFCLTCPVRTTSPVSQVSPAAKGFVVFVVWFLCGFFCLWFSGSVLLSVFVLFLVPFASLHALALSLTGA